MQDKLYAQDHYALLVIFQAMDAAGKDGAIKHVMSGLNPQGCQVYSFKAPSAEELDHDYLWRCFKALPERGRIGIFNRSYYEEVLITKVHPEIIQKQRIPEQSKDKKIYQRRYEEINNFEKYLFANGIIPVKFFLNVSKDEQKRRFLERIAAMRRTELSADARTRPLGRSTCPPTKTASAPSTVGAQYIADNKRVTRLSVAAIVHRRMAELKLAYPRSARAEGGPARTEDAESESSSRYQQPVDACSTSVHCVSRTPTTGWPRSPHTVAEAVEPPRRRLMVFDNFFGPPPSPRSVPVGVCRASRGNSGVEPVEQPPGTAVTLGPRQDLHLHRRAPLLRSSTICATSVT